MAGTSATLARAYLYFECLGAKKDCSGKIGNFLFGVIFDWICFCIIAEFLYRSGLWKRLTETQTLHTLINGEEGITNMFHLAAIPSQFLKAVHLYSVILTSCELSETTSNTFLVTPLW